MTRTVEILGSLLSKVKLLKQEPRNLVATPFLGGPNSQVIKHIDLSYPSRQGTAVEKTVTALMHPHTRPVMVLG